jgi:WS/DGAT/MGAT family acyltransferase
VPDPVALHHEPEPAGWRHLSRAAVGRARRTAQLVPLATRSTVAAAQAVQRRRRNEPHGALPLSGAVAPWNGTLSDKRTFAVTHLPLDEMKEVAALFDVTMNDVVLAVCSGSMRRLLLDRFELPDQPLVAMCPVSVSASLPPDRQSANRISVMFPSLATDIDDPLERLRAIHESARGAKAEQRLLGSSLVLDWAEHLTPVASTLVGNVYAGTGLSARHRPLQNALISNVPGPPIPLYFAGAEVLAAYPLGPAMEGCGLNITVFSYQGRVGFGFLACPQLLPDCTQLADGIGAAFDELSALEPTATPIPLHPDRPGHTPGPVTGTPRRTRSTTRRRVPA